MLQKRYFQKFCCLLFGLMILSACENDINKARKLANTDDVNVDIATKVKLIYKEEGRKVVVISAPELRRYFRNENRVEFPKGFKLEFFDRGNTTCTIIAGYGIRDESLKQMKATKGVKVVNRAGEKVETEEMIWEELKKEIRADGKVKIITPDDVLFGQGLLADETFSNYSLRKITGIVSVDDNNLPGR